MADEETRQRDLNRQSRASWTFFGPHRNRLHGHLIQAAFAADPVGEPRLVVLGSGNANDLRIADLLDRYSEVVLVDTDSEALEHSVRDVHVSSRGRVQLRNVDLRSRYVDARDRLGLDHKPSVVVSSCVLSQLIDASLIEHGSDRPELVSNLVLQTRENHVKTMLQAVPGVCRVLLVVDFVSNETAPELSRGNISLDPAEVERWVESGNFFHGCNPFAVCESVASIASELCPGAVTAIADAWRWQFSARRAFAVALIEASLT